jgi:hypothetical protein
MAVFSAHKQKEEVDQFHVSFPSTAIHFTTRLLATAEQFQSLCKRKFQNFSLRNTTRFLRTFLDVVHRHVLYNAEGNASETGFVSS